jgi:MYXO-CTERM domain-containing protein
MTKTILATAATLALASTAMAEVRSVTLGRSGPGYGINDGGGVISSVTNSFDTTTHQFNFTASFSDRTTNGFWLAVSPGPNPKGHSGELALIYFDASNTSNLRATVYAYNGLNGDNSWRDGTARSGTQTPDFIGALINGVNSTLTFQNTPGGGRTLGLSFDATFIQNHLPLDPIDRARNEWTGVAFGEQYGIWFHPVRGLQTSYGNNGELCGWDYSSQGWLDGGGIPTVPTPGAAAMLGLGALAATRRRRA